MLDCPLGYMVAGSMLDCPSKVDHNFSEVSHIRVMELSPFVCNDISTKCTNRNSPVNQTGLIRQFSVN